MDWDRVNAVDLMILFNSFVPDGGVVKKVTIYPSEFGKSRMKEDDINGPQELMRLAAEKRKKQIDEYEVLEKIEKGQISKFINIVSLYYECLGTI